MNKISDENDTPFIFQALQQAAGKFPTVNPFLKEEIHAFFRYKHQKEEMEQSHNFKTVTEMLRVP